MKALTISQPYASLIADGEKWVENRTWECLYTGQLLIHAGKGSQYLSKAELKAYPTGCIVATCWMRCCVHVPTLRDRITWATFVPYKGMSPEQCHAVASHEHTEGPFGFVLTDVVKLASPIPATGMQGLWNPSKELLTAISQQVATK